MKLEDIILQYLKDNKEAKIQVGANKYGKKLFKEGTSQWLQVTFFENELQR